VPVVRKYFKVDMGGTRIFEVGGQRGEGIGGQTKIVVIGLLTDEN